MTHDIFDDDYWGRTPAEAMEKLKQRNPDYDHKPQPPEMPTTFRDGSEYVCICGARIWLDEISDRGLRFTHLESRRRL
jgi:hypothetical protein